MTERRRILKNVGLSFIAFAIAAFVMSFIACILIQSGFLGVVPQIFGAVAYFGGPLPIIPAALGFMGILLLGLSSLSGQSLGVPPAQQTLQSRPKEDDRAHN